MMNKKNMDGSISACDHHVKDKNLPLTWDELREMEGELVYVVETALDVHYNSWRIISSFEDETDLLKACWKDSGFAKFVKDDKHWRAYRWKPEEE